MTSIATGNGLCARFGLARGMRVWFRKMPSEIRAELKPEANGLHEQDAPSSGLHAAIIFVVDKEKLKREVDALLPLLAPSGLLWVCWPVASSGIETDIDEAVVRAAADPHGLVDVAICPVDSRWCGLKFVLRREHGGQH